MSKHVVDENLVGGSNMIYQLSLTLLISYKKWGGRFHQALKSFTSGRYFLGMEKHRNSLAALAETFMKLAEFVSKYSNYHYSQYQFLKG